MEETRNEEVIAETVKETVIKKQKTKKTECKKVFGTVINCSALNVRNGPGLDQETLDAIKNGSKVEIADDSIPDWYGVITENGIHGFCMSKYISPNM